MRTGDRKKKRREEAFPADFDDRIMPGDDLLPDDFVSEETPGETERGSSRRRTQHQEAAVRDISKSLMEDETIPEESSGRPGGDGKSGRRGRRPRSRALRERPPSFSRPPAPGTAFLSWIWPAPPTGRTCSAAW